MHTDHSRDCATPVEVLLATARDQGSGRSPSPITTRSRARSTPRRRPPSSASRSSSGEEVKTADQGEVIGLFLEERIPRGLTLEETVAEIQRQGGLVYVPHPFDRMHAVPDYEHLLAILDDIHAIEVYNPRVAIGAFNEEAERFAAKYRILAGAGSDAHVAQGSAPSASGCPTSTGRRSSSRRWRRPRPSRKPSSLLYVQALKFLQTKATPPGARKGEPRAPGARATRNG